MKAIKIALLLACALFAAACLPVTSRTPVGAAAGLADDPALIGTWKTTGQKTDDGPRYLHIISGRNGALTALMISTGGEKAGGPDEWSVFSLMATRLFAKGLAVLTKAD